MEGGGRLNAAKYQSVRGLRVETRSRLHSNSSANNNAAKPVTGNAECIATHNGQASSASAGSSAVCTDTLTAELGSNSP